MGKHIVRRLVSSTLALLLAAPYVTTVAVTAQASGGGNYSAQVHLTLPDKSQLIQQQADMPFAYDVAPLPDEVSVRVDPTKSFQTMDGVGASMTESSAYLFSEKLTAQQRALVFQALFGKQNGAGIDVVRVPWGVTDFSPTMYTYNDLPAGQQDVAQNNFSINHDLQYIIPRLTDARAVNPGLKLFFAPWTPPAWMKNPFTPDYPLGFGFLKPGLESSYATYLAKAVNGYTANWLWPHAMSAQNEPQSVTFNYSMFISGPDQINLLKNHVGPTIANATMAKPKILAHDDSWSLTPTALEVMNDPGVRQQVGGTAFHCYQGDPMLQLLVQKAHPDKELHMTECTASNAPDTNWGPDFRWGMRNLMINTIRNHSKSIIYWNLALDETFGPRNNNTTGCQTCRGIMTVTNAGGVGFNPEYYILAHYGKFVNPGAQRIESTTYGEGAIETVAFKNTDGSKVLLALNSGATARNFIIREGNAAFRYSLPAGAAATFKWTMPDNTKRDVDTGRLEAETYAVSTPANLPKLAITDDGRADQAIALANNENLMFSNVTFQNTPASFQVRYRALTSVSGTLEFRLGSASGQLLATVPFAPGSGWQTSSVIAGSSIPPAGSQNLFVVAKGSGSDKLLELNWSKSASNSTSPDPVAGKASWQGYGIYGGQGADRPSNVFDGDNATRWTTGFPMTYGHYFTMDLGKQVSLNAVGVYSANGDRPRKVKVEISDNGLDYTVVQPSYSPPADLYQIPLTATAMGRYVRLTELSDTPQTAWWSINEVNLYYH